MHVGRWASAAAVAITAAIAPGVIRQLPETPPAPERAMVAGPPVFDLVAAAPTEVPITPPEELVGELAEPIAPPPTFAATPSSDEHDVYALLIGIDDYPGQRSDLRSAVADVDTIDAALQGFNVPTGNRVVLRDGQARLADVEAAVRSLVAQGGPNATYVLAYAGHTRKLDHDTEALVLADGELLRDRELAALLAPATTQRMWLLLASCFAGGFTEALGPGRVLTGAADAFNLAWEDPALNGSYLVNYLVRRGWLEGKAGDSVQEAFAWADTALAKDHPNRRPVQVDEAGTPLVLGRGDPTRALDAAPSVPDPRPPAPPPQQPPSSPPTTAAPPPPKEEEPCLLGVLYC
jgi:hypothetical protein